MLRSIKQTCVPLPGIISGSFNAEIFTANLRQVVEDHRNDRSSTPYSDPHLFFSQLTAPTSGMRQAVSKVARRLSGDAGTGAVTSLITGFGGGKTHTLIGMYHVATRGTEIGDAARSVVADTPLPSTGTVRCAVLVGDTMDVTRVGVNREKVPGTLWGDIARQIATPDVQEAVAFQSDDVAAPGDSFLDAVIGDRPCLVLIDEVAQYATRFEAAWPGRGAGNVGAFLMTLFNYAKRKRSVAIVLTLAETRDAFSSQTGELLSLVRNAAGDDQMTVEKASSIAEDSHHQIASVVARDAQSIMPVTPSEIAGVLAQRLFSKIDDAAADECADAYRIQRERQRIASQTITPERCRTLYPFHPSFIDLLTDKLSTVSTFQGTRGVLRTLALTVRAIWQSDVDMPSIHACHVDLTDRSIVDELIGRTNANNLAMALDKDVGGFDRERSVAAHLDASNPHPSGAPYHVLTWRTVFLHSLPGRGAGNRFGINESDAILACLMPLSSGSPEISVSQISVALSDIADHAYYLRNEDGVCFADGQASINLILRQIEENLPAEGVRAELRSSARSDLVAKGFFTVVGDVTHGDDVPDKAEPVVAIVDPYANEILPESIILETSRGKARVHQNVVHVLVPSCARVPKVQEDYIETQKGIDARRDAETAIRRRNALEKLTQAHAEYGFTSAEIRKILGNRGDSARIEALGKVAGLYRMLHYPTANGVASRQVSFAGQEGGRDSEKAILDALQKNNEVVDLDNAKRMAPHLRTLVFGDDETPTVASILDNFSRKRAWPLLQSEDAFEIVLRENVTNGHWAVFRHSSESLDKPDTFIDKSTGFPLTFEMTGSIRIVSHSGAIQRGWTKQASATEDDIASIVRGKIDEACAIKLDKIVQAVTTERSDLDRGDIENVVRKLVAKRDYLPDGNVGLGFMPDREILTKAEWQRRHGTTQALRVELSGTSVAGFIGSIGGLRRLPALSRAWKSTIGQLAFTIAIEGDGRMEVLLENLAPETMTKLDEYFEVLDTIGDVDANGDAELRVLDPVLGCPLVDAILAYRT